MQKFIANIQEGLKINMHSFFVRTSPCILGPGTSVLGRAGAPGHVSPSLHPRALVPRVLVPEGPGSLISPGVRSGTSFLGTSLTQREKESILRLLANQASGVTSVVLAKGQLTHFLRLRAVSQRKVEATYIIRLSFFCTELENAFILSLSA